MRSCLKVIVLLLLLLPFSAAAQTASSRPEQFLENLYNNTIVFDTAGVEPVALVNDPRSAWKHWKTIENFYFGKNRGSLPMIADLRSLHPYFRDKVIALMEACKENGITLAIVESYRTPAKQAEYFAMGKKYTSAAGGTSRHQYGLAVDVVPLVDSVAVWDNHKLWRKIGLAGERLGLRWGGRWRVTYDPGHFEWLGGLSRYQLAKGSLPHIPSSLADKYPAIEDELRQLQEYWQAWEVEQSVMASKDTHESATSKR